MEDRGIGWAVMQMKDGQRVCRAGWNGKGQWIAIRRPDTESRMSLPYVYISTVSDDQVPWLCSQTDLLATDWDFA